jgi:hypothetical protein
MKAQSNVANYLELVIAQRVKYWCSQGVAPELVEIIETDSLAEVIEKLIILHIRNWMLEDTITKTTSDAELGQLKRKLDICFKEKRPKLVQALNAMLDRAIISGRPVSEESIKVYKSLNQ